MPSLKYDFSDMKIGDTERVFGFTTKEFSGQMDRIKKRTGYRFRSKSLVVNGQNCVEILRIG